MKVCFFTTSSFDQVQKEQYTYTDFRILNELGYEVKFANKFLDIPWDCDLYFSWWVSGSILPWIVSCIIKKPIIVVAGGNEAICYVDSVTGKPHGYLAYGLLKRLAIRVVLRFSTNIVAVSSFMMPKLHELGARRTCVIHNSVDTDSFIRDEAVDQKYVTTTFRIDEDVLTLKRGVNFLKAIKIVCDNHPEVQPLIIGHFGNAYEYLISCIKELGLTDKIILTGSIQNVNVVNLLQRSVCYVQPSDTETFGVAVVEAMSVGCPVVLSRCGALPEVASDLAVYVDHNCISSIADGISTILKMPDDEKSRLSENLRTTVVNKFSYGKRKLAIEQLIKTAMGDRY